MTIPSCLPSLPFQFLVELLFSPNDKNPLEVALFFCSFKLNIAIEP